MTGVLPIASEDATKALQVLLLSGKEYVCVMRLHATQPKDKVKAVLEELQSAIFQRPPVRSSVKRRLRVRTVYYLDLLESEGRNVLFRVGCESGTYIRKLCYDIGEILGCGAHMQELRRTRVGPLTEDENLVTLYDLLSYASVRGDNGNEEAYKEIFRPMEKTLALLPRIHVRDSAVSAICHGANVAAPGVLSLDSGIRKEDGMVVFTQKGEAVAFARALVSSQEILDQDHGFVAETVRVLMDRDVYPKMWKRGNT